MGCHSRCWSPRATPAAAAVVRSLWAMPARTEPQLVAQADSAAAPDAPAAAEARICLSWRFPLAIKTPRLASGSCWSFDDRLWPAERHHGGDLLKTGSAVCGNERLATNCRDAEPTLNPSFRQARELATKMARSMDWPTMNPPGFRGRPEANDAA